MKFNKKIETNGYDQHQDLVEFNGESIDHSGILVASIAALIIILVGIFTSETGAIFLMMK